MWINLIKHIVNLDPLFCTLMALPHGSWDNKYKSFLYGQQISIPSLTNGGCHQRVR